MDNQIADLDDMNSNSQNDVAFPNNNALKDDAQTDTNTSGQSTANPSFPGTSSLENNPLVMESSPKIDTLQNLEKHTSPEIIPSLEKQLPEQPPLPQPPQTSPQQNVQVQNSAPVENVVNKLHEEQELSPIEKPGDKLTEEADEQEEHFIEEVDKHHGS